MGVNLRSIPTPYVNDRARQAKVERMAQDLIRFDAFRDERDAIRALTWCGRYNVYDVLVLVDDVRQRAMQETVAREMSRP
jgi:AmiR/NasT family two-component response regulator